MLMDTQFVRDLLVCHPRIAGRHGIAQTKNALRDGDEPAVRDTRAHPR
jgi:hypothetical protein